MIKSNIILT